MPSFGEQLARLRVARETGRLPADVAAWALELVVGLEPAAERVAERNRLLREAAGQLSGSRWARARRLQREIEALGSHPALRERASDDGVAEIVARACELAPAPRSLRQLLTILAE